MPYTQENRLITLTTPLGDDVLLLQGLTGNEGISRMFRFNLDLLSEKNDIKFEDIIGQRVTITVTLPDGSDRYFNGFVSRFAQSGSEKRFTHYQMEVVPWLWFLTRTADCQIFQNFNIPDILQIVFADHGYSDFKNSLTATYNPVEYCVQYRETDFNFVSRLMEQYGIFYFFEHEENKHTLVLADSPSAIQPCPGQESAHYNVTSGDLDAEDVITAWHIEQELRTGKYSLQDYNFETPSANLESNDPTVFTVGGNTKFEIFDYPGDYTNLSDGGKLAKIRMQEEEASHKVATGSSVCRAFTSGYKFDLKDHYREDMNDSYLLTEVQHVASMGGSYTHDNSDGAHYSNHFTSILASVPFRPARVTPKPFVQGPQTALVVGKAGEEIWVDKYGRVKVQFYWDRLGQRDEDSSCWIRVSQPWAGQNWGAMWIPRIGQEVVVSFVEGDPDRPLITGRVYNADQTVPYGLPDHQTRSGFKSRSSKGGGPANFNEIRFEDKKGSEDVLIHAERTMHNSVEASQFITVGVNRNITTGYCEDDGSTHGDVKEFVYGNHNLIVMLDARQKILGSKSLHVVGDQLESIDGNMHLNVGKDRREYVDGDYTLMVGGSMGTETTSLSFKVDSNAVLAADTVIIKANTAISINGPGGFVKIDQSGVTISGTMVLINSGGSQSDGTPMEMVQLKSPVEPDEPDA
jgi:type VI secretion system secreted protein VgrG